MATIKEPKGIDFVGNSEPWSEKELKEFRKLMKKRNQSWVKRNKPK